LGLVSHHFWPLPGGAYVHPFYFSSHQEVTSEASTGASKKLADVVGCMPEHSNSDRLPIVVDS